MSFFDILNMIGGLALFLYGMKTMGDALSKLAGGKLERILEHMTNNPLKAVVLGAGVTAVIQSSSATTVMIVGFVNSGIMKLAQAAPVIMGANIGTTATSWILSLTGIESGNFFVQMLKPSSFTPIVALAGVVLLIFMKDDRKNNVGTILIGFAVLMFGMETMSSAVKPLAEIPEFTNLFTAFENPILGMAVGAVLTALIQSSSASVGILQAMCATGSVSVGSALPIIMGQNIGTCITALLSGVGAGKNARRASLVHLYFNLIGTFLFMGAFYAVNAFVHFHFLSDAATVATIATIHSIFNIVTTTILLPLSGKIEKLAYLTIPVTDDESVYVKQDEISAYLTKLSAKSLSEKDSMLVGKFGKCIIDFERISDYLKGIGYILKKMEQKEEKFSKKAVKERNLIFQAAVEILENTVECFVHEDRDMAVKIYPLYEVITFLKEAIRKNHNMRLSKGKCSVELGMALTDIVTSLERIAGHCSNIAEEEIAAETDQHALHQYARNIREKSELYKELLAGYTKKYSLEKTEES